MAINNAIQNSSTQAKIIGSNTLPIKPPVSISTNTGNPNTTAFSQMNFTSFFSSKLLNFVEKVTINGYSKTAFYTELATRFKIGDKVFIINGFYDSDTLIKSNKYRRSTDGYEVLGVDGCKVILDIPYTGQLPYTNFNLNDLFFVHNITSQSQFDYVNSLNFGLSQSNYQGVFTSFLGYNDGTNVNLVGGNIIFVNQSFKGSSQSDIFNSGVSFPMPGFYYKQNDGQWIDLNSQFDDGLISDGNESSTAINKNRIIVIGEDFTYKNKTYRERLVYRYESGKWMFDKEYKQPVISKLNFRYGKFSGTHQDGIFGEYDRVAKWNNSIWKSGILINALWNSGEMQNKSTSEQSYSAKIVNGTVVQNVDYTNNRGFGYNYIIDSTIKEAKIKQSNFENTNIGLTSGYNAIDTYYLNGTTYSVTVDKATFNFCDIFSSYLANSSVSDSIIENSTIYKSKTVNNQLIDTIVDNCQYNSDGGLQILAADLWSHDPAMKILSLSGTPSDITTYDQFDFSTVRGKLKLYISDKDYLRLEKSDSFYLEKINKEYFISNLTTDDRIHLPIETRYILDYYLEHEFYQSEKSSNVAVTLNPKLNNTFKNYIYTGLIQTPKILKAPNTAQFGTNTYWLGGYVYRGTWDADGVYSDLEVVNYSEKLFYRELGLTDSNNQPIEGDTASDRSWTTLATTYSYWDSTIPNLKNDFVFASSIETLANIDFADGFTFSLYKCLIDTTDGAGGVITESIEQSTQIVRQKTKQVNISPNQIDYCSIDIESEIFGWYLDTYDNNKKKYSRVDSPMNKIPVDKISSAFTNNYIKPSDFRSGLFINSVWQSGQNVNYYSNRITKFSGDKLFIFYSSPKELSISLINKPHSHNYLLRGLDIKKGDSVWLNGVSYTGTNSNVSLNGRYKVLNDPFRSENTKDFTLIIQPQFETPDFNVSTLTYSVFGAEGNTYVSLSKFSIEDSVVNYGFFRRTQFKNVSIQNDQFDNTDTTFKLTNINLLRLVNILYNDNNIEVNDGILYRSHIVNGTFNTGIVHNSIWNGNTFNSGIFSFGSWESGDFLSGKFIGSNLTSAAKDSHDSRNFYKNWQNGQFFSGEFLNSVWLNGTFSNGRFYNSHFYGGVWENGILGSNNTNLNNTTFGHYAKLPDIGTTVSIWNTGIVENALLGGNGVVYWYGGKMNSGEFTSFGSTSDNESIWYDGEFNGSKFTELARWKNGVFNSGKFWSHYGWENVGPTNSSNNSDDYAWENGRFKSGEFGNKGLTANAVWYDGIFQGGQFLGRFWKNGYFISGNFYGSGLTSGLKSSVNNDDEYLYADSFTYSYYGIWNDGIVVENVQQISGNVEYSENNTRFSTSISKATVITKANFSNVLWVSGTFSHDNGTINDSLFLSGDFSNGEFIGGVFNPYIDRDFSGSFSNATFGENAIWNNGIFVTGSFWMSDWNGGTFKNGFMSGARWLDGTWEYGSANNMYWENGIWKNGNWNGSPYNFGLLTQTESNIDGVTVSQIFLDDGREKDVILKLTTYNDLTNSTFSATQANIHMLNVFSVSNSQVVFDSDINSITNWTFSSAEKYIGLIKTGGSNTFPVLQNSNLSRSNWEFDSQLTVVTSFETTTYGGVGSKKVLQTSVSYDGNIKTSGGTNSYYAIQPLLGYNIYQQTDVPPSSRLYATYSGSQNIFVADYDYSIVITLGVELVPEVELEFFVGGLSSSVFKLKSDEYKWTERVTSGGIRGGVGLNIRTVYYNSYYPKFYTITLAFNTNATNTSGDGAKFSFRKNSNGIVRIIKSQITRRKVQYHPLLNNTLYSAINLLDSKIEFPATSSISYNTLSSNGYFIGLNFGNGLFKSGIWENGVWNNGYRSGRWFEQDDRAVDNFGRIIKASSINNSKTYRLSNNTWLVTVKCYDDFAGLIEIGDLISVSNIVIFDINGNRNFFREPLLVVDIDAVIKEITFEYTNNFEVRNVVKDSELHLIYITKNIWQNGVFLNGYFEGIWNNGVFIGYPRTTEMVDSHWLNGYFDGGHFVSTKVLQNVNEGLPEYNSGMIQNMVFKDRNTAPAPTSLYESWIDVNYSTFSSVNLSIYSRLAGISKGSVSRPIETYIPNLKGNPTEDVFYSESYFRNNSNNTVRKYVLGSKFKTYSDILGQNSKFDTPFIYSPTGNLTATELQIQQKAPLSNLLDKGWTFAFVGDTTVTGNKVSVYSNVSSRSDEKLILHSLVESDAGQSPPRILFENTKFISAPNRYYFTEIQVSNTASNFTNTNGNSDKPSVWMNEYATYQPQAISLFNFENFTTVREYFFNVKSCKFNILIPDGTGASLSITKMAIYETDSIPFFQYATASKIDLSIKTPNIGIAPPIDYTNQNSNFVGNNELGIDYRTIVQQNSELKRQNGFSKEISYSALEEELGDYTQYSGNIKIVPPVIKPPGGGNQGG